MKKNSSKYKIGITVGDINGIGVETIIKVFSDARICELCQPIAIGSKKLFQDYSKLLNIKDLKLNYISSIDEVKGKIPSVLTIWDDNVDIEVGKESSQSGLFAYKSLEATADLLVKNEIDAMVTAPINKMAIQSADFDFPGHTEFLQKLDNAEQSLMLMISDVARIGVVTGHLPLSEVKNQLTTDLILSKITILNKSLKEDFGIRKPKIAILGLNPHAGDNGLLGPEEKEVIMPAIQQAKSIEILAIGPYAADGFFASSNYKNFDGILAMYHDQGLIPAKMLSVGSGINYTAGLSFVRTSPDHGTAFDIAGKGVADESSLRNAIYRAIEIVKTRNENELLEKDVLVKNKSRN